MDTEIVVHPLNEILLSNKQTIHTCNHMVSKALYVVEKNGYILYDSVYLTFWKRQKSRYRNQMSGCQAGRKAPIQRGMRKLFGVTEMFLS